MVSRFVMSIALSLSAVSPALAVGDVQRQTAVKQVRRIVNSCIIHDSTYDAMPSSLYELYTAGIISPTEVVSPFRDTTVPEDFSDLSEHAQRQWFAKRPFIIVFEDITYDVNTVAVIQPTPQGVDGMPVAYGDGHAVWHTPPYKKLRQQLKRQTDQTLHELTGKGPPPHPPSIASQTRGDARYCIVLFHGWRVTSAQMQRIKAQLEAVLRRRGVADQWHTVVVDWRKRAGHDPALHARFGPTRAAGNGATVGVETARKLVGYEKYWAIGHSAGCHPARNFCRTVDQRESDAWLYATYLDAFFAFNDLPSNPTGDVADFALNVQDTFAQTAERASNIRYAPDVASFYLTPDQAEGAYVIEGVSGPRMDGAYNIDVSALFPSTAVGDSSVTDRRGQVAVALEAGSAAKDITLAVYSARHAWPRDWFLRVLEARTHRFHHLMPVFGSWSRHDEEQGRGTQTVLKKQ